MEVNYQCTFADYKEAMYSQMSGPLVASFLGLGGLFFLIVGMSIGIRNGFSGAVAMPLLGGLFLILPLLLRVFQRFWVEQDFRKHPHFAGTVRMVADPEGVKTAGELERRETKWSAFTKYRETENLFVLYEGARLIPVFPKRAFSTHKLDEFRVLLASKITTAQSQSADKHL
jgi:YcxB-like protein